MLLLFVVRQARLQGREPLLPFAVFRDRNFTLMAIVLAAMGFAMVGLFLPLTIYYQSVLGLSALAAGLAMAPQPLAMVFSSSAAGALTAKVHGKLLLIPGLLLFAAGMAYVTFQAHAAADRWHLVPGLVVAGIGLGFVWVPVYSVATRDLRPALAGVAQGVISTVQELGAVVATAVVGALLQNRLASALHEQAVQRAGGLPAPYRERFVAGFSHAATGGLDIGAGQTGAALPAGTPSPVAAAARQVFDHGFVAAMRPTLLVPIALILVAGLLCFLVRRSPVAASEEVAEPIPA